VSGDPTERSPVPIHTRRTRFTRLSLLAGVLVVAFGVGVSIWLLVD